MTTIVFDKKNNLVACDSFAVADQIVSDREFIKWREVDGVFYFFSGIPGDIDFFFAHGKARSKPTSNIEVSCITVKDSVVYKCGIDDDSGYWQDECTSSHATGSGRIFALSSLDHGMTAKEAVEYAATRDIYTGGKVHVFDVNKMAFVD